MSEAPTLEQFPCFYTFKVFGRSSETFVPRIREIVGARLGEVPLDAIKVRQSAQGRYLSLTIIARVYTRSQLEEVYRDLHAEEEVLLYI